MSCGRPRTSLAAAVLSGWEDVAFGVLGAFAALWTLPCDADAQAPATVVQTAHMRVDVTAGDGSAAVEIDYTLSGTITTDALGVELLGFGSATVAEVVYCCWAGEAKTIVLWPTTGSHTMASIPFPALTEGEEGPPPLQIRYQVTGAVTEEGSAAYARIPVLSVELPPLSGGGDVFSVSLVLPAKWVLTEGFPTGLRRGDDGRASVTLPVVPSLVSFRARSDGKWRPGLPLIIDVLAAALILLAGFLGWLHLKRLPS